MILEKYMIIKSIDLIVSINLSDDYIIDIYHR